MKHNENNDAKDNKMKPSRTKQNNITNETK